MAEIRAVVGVPTAANFGGYGAPTPAAPIVVNSTSGSVYSLTGADVVKNGVFDGSISVGKTSGLGIKVEPSAPTFPWRDLVGEVVTRGVGATDPDWAQIGAGPFYAYQFSLNDQCWMPLHVPHDIVPGASIYIHTHWLSDGTDTNTVKWQYKYSFAKGFNQGAFNTTGNTITAEEAGSGTAYQHMTTETVAISGTAITEPDGMLLVNITRIANGGTDNTDAIFMLTSDIHYQSTNIGTKAKAPGFYT